MPTKAAAARDNAPQLAEGDDDGEDGQTFQVAAVKPTAKVQAPAVQKPAAPKVALALPTPADRGWKKGPDAKGVDPRPVAAFATRDPPSPDHPRLGEGQRRRNQARRQGAAPKPQSPPDLLPTRMMTAMHPGGKGWIIQLGATDDVAKANALLARARTHSRAAARRRKAGHRESAQGWRYFYRARFAGLEHGSAQSACRDSQAKRIFLLRGAGLKAGRVSLL